MRRDAQQPPAPSNTLKTLDRVLSKAGLGSRTDAREWIADGRVSVNGKKILNPEQWIDIEQDRVLFDGKPLRSKQKRYVLLYKPKGYITTYKDPEGRPTVYDLLSGIEDWIAPAGRLDQDTTGLLILTNDNEFADLITSPESHVPKTYLVKTSSLISNEDLERLRTGVELSDGPTRPALVTRVRDSASATFLEMTITEGRNRQVRRMIEAIGSRVRKLVRVAIGPLEIGKLEIGNWRDLSSVEVTALRRAAHTTSSTVRPSRAKR